jgi:hypothetical protein
MSPYDTDFLFRHFHPDDVYAFLAARDDVRALAGAVPAPCSFAETIPVPTVSTIPVPRTVPCAGPTLRAARAA